MSSEPRYHDREIWESRGTSVEDFKQPLLNASKQLILELQLKNIWIQQRRVRLSDVPGYDVHLKDKKKPYLMVYEKLGDDSPFYFTFGSEVASDAHLFYDIRYKDAVDRHLYEFMLYKELISSYRISGLLHVRNTCSDYMPFLGVPESNYVMRRNDLGDLFIDHYTSPFRAFRRPSGYTEAIGSEMWFGEAFWNKTGADRRALDGVPGVECADIRNGLTYVRACEPFTVENPQIALAADLRRILYPTTYNRDQGGHLRT